MNAPRINRPSIKFQAKRTFGVYWKVCVLSALLYLFISWLLDLFQNRVIPLLSIHVPEAATRNADAFLNWAVEYAQQLPTLWDWRNTVISVLVSIIIFMVITPLRFGLYEIAMKLSGGYDARLADMGRWFFSGIRILRSIFLTIAVAFLSTLWSMLFLAPSAILITAGILFSGYPVSIPLQTLGAVLGIVGIIAGIVRATAYFIAYYLLAENPDTTVRQALRSCRALVAGRRGEVFLLFLSFFPWFLLSALTYGALNLFVTPYLNLTVGYYIRAVRDAKNPPPVWELK